MCLNPPDIQRAEQEEFLQKFDHISKSDLGQLLQPSFRRSKIIFNRQEKYMMFVLQACAGGRRPSECTQCRITDIKDTELAEAMFKLAEKFVARAIRQKVVLRVVALAKISTFFIQIEQSGQSTIVVKSEIVWALVRKHQISQGNSWRN
ncbi:643_t:CDS:2 [Paraglomus occultum]|uniref:643_t:CDS:1 n=1 Tax=Paraglomus occultum TaxID=144539 RepID=A0A9N9C0X7_9GLOM|nr:643_t:CDS:2 [Paraglomus occultum]